MIFIHYNKNRNQMLKIDEKLFFELSKIKITDKVDKYFQESMSEYQKNIRGKNIDLSLRKYN